MFLIVMADMAEMVEAIWNFQVSHDKEKLAQKLLLATLKLENLKSEVAEEITKNKEHINQLIRLLRHALDQRDLARSQLHTFLVNRELDRATVIIDDLARGRVLPPKGKLLQAVVQAGPLLQTLLVPDSLPRWRNPPRFDPFPILPPASLRGCDQAELGLPNTGYFGQSRIQSAMAPVAPVTDFAGMGHQASGSYATLSKRQRLC